MSKNFKPVHANHGQSIERIEALVDQMAASLDGSFSMVSSYKGFGEFMDSLTEAWQATRYLPAADQKEKMVEIFYTLYGVEQKAIEGNVKKNNDNIATAFANGMSRQRVVLTTICTPELSEFLEKCRNFDTYYHYTDDGGVFRHWRDEEERLKQLAEEHGGFWQFSFEVLIKGKHGGIGDGNLMGRYLAMGGLYRPE